MSEEMVELINSVEGNKIWSHAPTSAFHWERLSRSKCVWHCRESGVTFSKKAPNFNTQKRSLWRDIEKQKEADHINDTLCEKLLAIKVVLV